MIANQLKNSTSIMSKMFIIFENTLKLKTPCKNKHFQKLGRKASPRLKSPYFM